VLHAGQGTFLNPLPVPRRHTANVRMCGYLPAAAGWPSGSSVWARWWPYATAPLASQSRDVRPTPERGRWQHRDVRTNSSVERGAHGRPGLARFAVQRRVRRGVRHGQVQWHCQRRPRARTQLRHHLAPSRGRHSVRVPAQVSHVHIRTWWPGWPGAACTAEGYVASTRSTSSCSSCSRCTRAYSSPRSAADRCSNRSGPSPTSARARVSRVSSPTHHARPTAHHRLRRPCFCDVRVGCIPAKS
jgi:hypothetical protein